MKITLTRSISVFYSEKIISVFFLILFFHPTTVLAQQDQNIEKVFRYIKATSRYDSIKMVRINSLRNELKEQHGANLATLYDLNQQLFHEFLVFEQDSAFKYGLKVKDMAEKLDSFPLIAKANINLSQVNISAGMYKEGLDLLEPLDAAKLKPTMRSDYFALLGRCYSEMAKYSNLPYYSSTYRQLALKYNKAALALTETGEFNNLFLQGIIQYDQDEIKAARKSLKLLLKQKLKLHQKALVTSVLGFINEKLGNRDQAVSYLAQAAVADIKASTKETLATTGLAEILFKAGKTKAASILIQKSRNDADFYGAQQRKIGVGAILPIIEQKIVSQKEQQRLKLYNQNILMASLLLFAIILAVVTYFQMSRLKRAKKIISKAHKSLKKINREIMRVSDEIKSKNAQLNKLNDKLLEANKIKEENIGFFFTRDAEIFEKFKAFKSTLESELAEDNIDKLRYTVKSLNLKREKEKLLKNFDESFIKLFPAFVEEFNSLLKPEETIKLKKDQILNKELRIFALMRLGIKHHEIIAKILGFTVNSVYTYKTKIRKKSRFHSKDFDQKLIENTTLKL